MSEGLCVAEFQMFIVFEVNPCIEEIQFDRDIQFEMIYNSTIEDLWS